MKQIVEHRTIKDVNLDRILVEYNYYANKHEGWEMLGSPMYINNGVYCLVLVRYGDD